MIPTDRRPCRRSCPDQSLPDRHITYPFRFTVHPFSILLSILLQLSPLFLPTLPLFRLLFFKCRFLQVSPSRPRTLRLPPRSPIRRPPLIVRPTISCILPQSTYTAPPLLPLCQLNRSCSTQVCKSHLSGEPLGKYDKIETINTLYIYRLIGPSSGVTRN